VLCGALVVYLDLHPARSRVPSTFAAPDGYIAKCRPPTCRGSSSPAQSVRGASWKSGSRSWCGARGRATACVCAEHVWRALLTVGVYEQVEELKKSLLLFGGHTSQVTKDVLRDFRKLKGVRPGLRSALPGSALNTLQLHLSGPCIGL